LWRIGKAGFSCYNVTLLPKSLCSTLFDAVYKRPLKEGLRFFAFCLWLLLLRAFWAWVFWGSGLIILRWAFGCGKILEGKRITEGKRIAKGKLLKGKEWLKRG
jgi:hypothetical protein